MLLNSFNSSPTPTPAPLIGSLLVSSQILAQKPLNHALSVAQNSKEPIGKVLVNLGHLKERDLRSVLLAQSLIAKGFVSSELAIKALRLSYRKFIALDTAFDELQNQIEHSSSLCDLLLKANFIDHEIYQETATIVKETGMTPGRYLLLQGTITQLELKEIVEILALLYNGSISEKDAIENLVNIRLKQTLCDQTSPLLKKTKPFSINRYLEYSVFISALFALAIAVFISLNSLLLSAFLYAYLISLSALLIIFLKISHSRHTTGYQIR